MTHEILDNLLEAGHSDLAATDPELTDALLREYRRQTERLMMVASASVLGPSVLACLASVPVNVTAEGYPGKRYHAGTELVDVIERLAVERALAAFGARYANVQPHAATTANQMVMSALLRPGERLLGMDLDHGGHLSHGAKVAFSGQYFDAAGYGLTPEGLIDYDQVERLAHEHRPRLIVCGATAYSRNVDFARFRAIADEVGAYLLADISHIAGLVVAGLHQSPIDHAHVTTTCTHKQLFGPRGGLILMGRDADSPAPRGKGTFADFLQRALFPFFQGSPMLNAIAAKAHALALVTTERFAELAARIVEDAAALAACFADLGYRLVGGGSDNHIVLLDLTEHGVSGLVAERALEESYVIVNKNRVPGDTRPPLVTSGIRLGTNTLALRGLRAEEMRDCARLIDTVVSTVEPDGDRDYSLDTDVRDAVRAEVQELCRRFPIPGYPLATTQHTPALVPVG